MLTAFLNKKKVNTLEDELKHSKKYVCRFCGKTLRFVNSKKRIKHFRHLKGESCIENYPETNELHHYMEMIMLNYFQLKGYTAKLEHIFELNNDKIIADVFIPKLKLAIEVQNKHTSCDVSTKNKSYEKLGMTVWWIFNGGKLRKQKRGFFVSEAKGRFQLTQDKRNFLRTRKYIWYLWTDDFKNHGLAKLKLNKIRSLKRSYYVSDSYFYTINNFKLSIFQNFNKII